MYPQASHTKHTADALVHSRLKNEAAVVLSCPSRCQNLSCPQTWQRSSLPLT